jgi:hypothetical protein
VNLANHLASTLVLGSLLERIKEKFESYDLLAHWTQGEFHHDLVLRAGDRFVVVATNCNGGVKEVIVTDAMPSRGGLWKMRCPGNPSFVGDEPKVLERSTTIHFFDPCELLTPDARSEYKPEARERQEGGGWICKK